MIEEARKLLDSDLISIDSINATLKEINDKLSVLSSKNDFTSDEYVSLTKKLNKTNEVKEKYEKLEKLIKAIDDSTEMINNSDDEELKELATEEIKQSEEELPVLISSLQKLTSKPLPNDESKAIFEIRPGVGGVEASLFAEELYRMYSKYLSNRGYKVDMISMDYEAEGGIKEAVFVVEEADVFGEMRFEAGVHRVQRVPVTESGGRIHTSTASVAILPQIDKKQIEISPEDLRIDVYRSSGPGGQSVNTTDSAVRITHIPTGITVACQNGKSQHKNKEMALSILQSKLNEIEEEKKMKKEKQLREAAILGGDRSAKIRTYNFQQSRVTDHRVNQSWFNIEEIINGGIDEIVDFVNTTLRATLKK